MEGSQKESMKSFIVGLIGLVFVVAAAAEPLLEGRAGGARWMGLINQAYSHVSPSYLFMRQTEPRPCPWSDPHPRNVQDDAGDGRRRYPHLHDLDWFLDRVDAEQPGPQRPKTYRDNTP